MSRIILELQGLGKDFSVKSRGVFAAKKQLVAVDKIDIKLKAGETLGLVGESGCGKTTLGKLICRLETPDRGQLLFKGKAIQNIKGELLRIFRQQFQPIFQDPLGSLNPRLSIAEVLSEALKMKLKKVLPKDISNLLNRVGSGLEILNRYPHQLSGGQRQRIGIARALALKPDLLIADEPVSSLDVSIQAQIMNLFLKLQQDTGLSMIFISHDLRVVSHLADTVAVMYLGRIMEIAPVQDIFDNPTHPYTQALLEALPRLKPGRGRKRTILSGELPSPINPGPGCRFYTRCCFRHEMCLQYENELLNVAEKHQAACIRWKKRS